eukprot:CAMPEP_0174338088 /NCGR_PEP_ID=MMETSP0810-20121108/22875_1 /TAXON_ID=73025 ORGANISM="Eutreptiella gymnastica-like, Strain CCMP1594" /NCGR_SAMPLE_ID=MMETSP0810 /ASSEMBLY_ACC=CAM_ASM_000659 /LENGTH=208 /DNA_ID=CAMNT_0015458001 /DNA_START=37 /DNA_END=661 /DNA_ORIENTATION=+
MSSEISSVLWDEPQKNSNDGFFTADYSQSGGGGEFNAAPPFNYSYPSPTDPTNFDDEKPLLEELGIDFGHIRKKNQSLQALHGYEMNQDADLAGPLFFAIFLGCLLLLSGKVHFGYIFGMGIMGCVFLYALLNVMSAKSVELQYTVSTLGYCLCPTIVLGIWRLLALVGLNLAPWWMSYPMGIAMIGWSSICATKMFVDGLDMSEQRW